MKPLYLVGAILCALIACFVIYAMSLGVNAITLLACYISGRPYVLPNGQFLFRGWGALRAQ
jgi:hypothetical protein